MIPYLLASFGSETFFWIRLKQSNNQIFVIWTDLVFFWPSLRPLDFSPKYVVKDCFLGEIGKGSDSDNYFIGNDPKGKPINSLSSWFSFDDLWSDVIRGTEKGVRFFYLFFLDEFGEVEICKCEVPIFADDDVILNRDIFTGLRSLWMIPREWIDSIASTKLAK